MNELIYGINIEEIERINENMSSNSKYNENLLNITNRQNDYSLNPNLQKSVADEIFAKPKFNQVF